MLRGVTSSLASSAGRRSLMTMTRVSLAKASPYLFPSMSPTMETGRIIKWYKKAGDKVNAGDQVINVETDKAKIDVEATEAFVLAKILIGDESPVIAVNTPIGFTLPEGEDWTKAEYPTLPPAPAAPATKAQVAAPAAPAAAPAPKAPETKASTAPLSPAVLQLVSLHNLDASRIPATGPHGRLLKGDVLQFIEKGGAPATTAASPATAPKPKAAAPKAADHNAYTEIPVSRMRSVIAQRLTASKFTIPHKYTTMQIALDRTMALRKQINSTQEEKERLSINDFVIKAVAAALRQVPEVNVIYTNDEMVPCKTVDISVAVAIDGGLITPIIKNADTLGLRAISRTTKDLATRARAQKLEPEEYNGGTFSVSNLGMFGISEFTAVINPPQAAILAVSGSHSKPIANQDGTISFINELTVTLSTDQRAISPEDAARFLVALKKNLEDPLNILQ